MLGLSYDWSREINSSSPAFYQWTQWFFTLMYEKGLAYRDTNWQWWCPTCQTTLSSQEAAGGVCWRGHTGLTKREIPAWYFRITAYADELLAGLEHIDWPEPIKTMQRNWIGKSEGVEIDFQTAAVEPIRVFTTRPDTTFGATFLVLAPEHPAVKVLTTPSQRSAVDAYISVIIKQDDILRTAIDGKKSGVPTGSYAVNPANGEQIPIWIGNYVLPDYGSGAVMGVPAHDQRDFDFAHAYNLPIRVAIAARDYSGESIRQAYMGDGKMIDAGQFTGRDNQEGAESFTDWLETEGLGRRKVQYRMHDWLISRQRYWGTPIPIVYCRDCGEVPVPADDLPVTLPPMDDFMPNSSGRSPLARARGFCANNLPRMPGACPA